MNAGRFAMPQQQQTPLQAQLAQLSQPQKQLQQLQQLQQYNGSEQVVRDESKKKSFTNIQGYMLHEILGKGSFGQVFKATKNGKAFAIKMIDKPLIRKKNLQKYVNNEVKVMRELKNPNTVRLYEAFEDKDVLYLVMECCNQGTLFNYILKEKPQEPECIRIFAQIMRGFIEIHEKHILHRDLKPSNIFIKDGVFKIADFGLAKPKALGSSYCGTSYFMAPEILMKQIHDYKVDLWSMGVILFFMLFREYPFKNSAKLLDEIKEKTTPIFELEKCLKHPRSLPFCSEGAAHLFQRIFVIDPSQRISFKELYDMELFDDYFSQDELHHSSKIYQDLEKQPPKPAAEDHHEDEDDDKHHHQIHHSSNHHYNHHPKEELQSPLGNQSFNKTKTSKFRPPLSPTSVNPIDKTFGQNGGLPPKHPNALGNSPSKNNKLAGAGQGDKNIFFNQENHEITNNYNMNEIPKRVSVQEIFRQSSHQAVGDEYREVRISITSHPMNIIHGILSTQKSPPKHASQQYQQFYDDGFEDDHANGIHEDESPHLVVNHIRIIKNPSVNTPNQAYIRYFGPKAFQGDSAILPRPLSHGATEDEDTSIPNAPSSFSAVYAFGHNSFTTKGLSIDNLNHSFGLGNKNNNNNSQNHKISDKNQEGEEEFEEELMHEVKVEEPDNNQNAQISSSSSESADSSFLLKQQNLGAISTQKTEQQKQYESFKLIEIGDEDKQQLGGIKTANEKDSKQAIAFPEKEDVSNDSNMKKMPIRKAPSLTMNMMDFAVKDKMRKQIIDECDEMFESHAEVYLYEIGVYGILGDTIDALNVMNLGSSTQALVSYILAKLLLFFAKKLQTSLSKKINTFNLAYFSQFVESSSSKLILGKINRDIDQWSTKFSLFYYGIDYERDIQSEEVRKIVTEEITETDFDKQLKIPSRLVLDLIFKASYKMGRYCSSALQASGILRTCLYTLLSMLINNVFDKKKVRDHLYYYFHDQKNLNEETLDFVNFNLWTAQAHKESLLDQIHHLIKVVFGENKLNILKQKI